MAEYKILISSFLDKGYQTDFFSDSIPVKGKLILRHDIDFDIKYAFQLSQIEDELNIKSTYFFMLGSKFYNILERENIEMIESIKSRGHKISLHFDPTIYTDIESGLLREVALFESLFKTQINYISIHRPSTYFLNNANTIAGINHTYQPIFFKKIKYFADSQGSFRYGHPLDSDEFKSFNTIQLLIHPIWWVTQSQTVISKLNEFLETRIGQFKQHMAFNCIPYKKYIEEN